MLTTNDECRKNGNGMVILLIQTPHLLTGIFLSLLLSSPSMNTCNTLEPATPYILRVSLRGLYASARLVLGSRVGLVIRGNGWYSYRPATTCCKMKYLHRTIIVHAHLMLSCVFSLQRERGSKSSYIHPSIDSVPLLIHPRPLAAAAIDLGASVA
ncbi:hypothetical protein F5Y14DRAFT_431246 [Nemania sp. NC0429]|nr:hypothetical protein F5Y14DRAFT_431246 [Nemania sp. NC0429]